MLLGILYIVNGFLAWDNPLLTTVWLALILGPVLVASGIMRIFLVFDMKHGSPWVCGAFSGRITLALGGIILAHWPVSAVYTLGIFLGEDRVFAR